MYRFSDEDLNKIKELYLNTPNITQVAMEFCKSSSLEYSDSKRRAVSKVLERELVTNNTEDVDVINKIEEDYNFAKSRELGKSKFYIVTWEQNSTPIHKGLWQNILAYKEFLGAELSVILGRYKNPTSVFSDSEFESWNEETRPFWDATRHDIHKYLTILGDVKVQPTAAKPLTGLESITGETSTIIGHPKMHLMPVPVLEGHPKKVLLSTGAITVPNYTDSKSGKRGEFTHKLGFVIIEIKDEEVFFMRQVEAKEDGSFIDLIYEVNNGVVLQVDKADSLVWGDTHFGSINPEIIDSTNKLINKLNIEVEVHHDLIDGASVNNHIINNPVEQFRNLSEGKDNVEEELKGVVKFLKSRPNIKKVIVQSNHNDRFDRWIINQDWKKDIKNSLMYLKLTTAVLENKAPKGVLSYVLESYFPKDEVVCLDYDDSYMRVGYELAHHGHIGVNGSKGTIEQFRKMSTNVIIGHYHVPMRFDRALSVGTSSHLREGYNKGASSWLNAHILINKNGTAQHLIFVRGEFTTFEL